MKRTIVFAFLLPVISSALFAQKIPPGNDVNVPLHLLQPDYPVPYRIPSTEDITAVLERVRGYLEATTPAAFADRSSGAVIGDMNRIDTNTIFQKGDFRLTSYEWGVTYSGMLQAGEATGDRRFTEYTRKRVELLATAAPAFASLYAKFKLPGNPLRQVIAPHALDDAGAVCAAMIKALPAVGSVDKTEGSGDKTGRSPGRTGGAAALRVLIDRYIDYIHNREYRLRDGTFARNRPQKNTLWLDDLYMSVPALAQMGRLTGDTIYYNDAVRQVLQFSSRMFNREAGLYMHGWVEDMEPHPEFHWARANGWALMAMTELLDVLPENYPGRGEVIRQLRLHIKGLAALQSDKGLWHQLLDKNDSYLETSASAIYVYCIARAIDKGWVDAMAYGPLCVLGWNAVATRVNDRGQVVGTCVGTGMAFDPAFYYYRPVNVYAAHGYGPLLLAGAEMITLLRTHAFQMNDSSIQLKK